MGLMDLDGNFCETPRDRTVLAREQPSPSDNLLMQEPVVVGAGCRKVHPSHRMMQWAGVLYCAKCGCWGVSRIVLLAKPCRQTPSCAGVAALKRIHNFKAPTPNIVLVKGSSSRPRQIKHIAG